MIRLLMVFSLIGTITMIAICAPLSKTAKTAIPQSNVGIMRFNIGKGLDEMGDFYTQDNTVKNGLRRKIIEKSISILRSHGKSDEEIKEMMLQDFSISETTLIELLNAKNN